MPTHQLYHFPTPAIFAVAAEHGMIRHLPPQWRLKSVARHLRGIDIGLAQSQSLARRQGTTLATYQAAKIHILSQYAISTFKYYLQKICSRKKNGMPLARRNVHCSTPFDNLIHHKTAQSATSQTPVVGIGADKLLEKVYRGSLYFHPAFNLVFMA